MDGTGKVELPSDQFYKELEKPVLITGAVLFSTGPCVVSGNVINVTLCPEREINSGTYHLPKFQMQIELLVIILFHSMQRSLHAASACSQRYCLTESGKCQQ